MSVDNTYKVLLNKLIAGTITDKEKWQLEKASLDDPFLADAIEGYYEHSASADTIKNLTTKVNAYKKPSRTIVLRWLSIAASLFILLSVSFWLFNTHDPINLNSAEAEKTVSTDLEYVQNESSSDSNNDNLQDQAEQLTEKTVSKVATKATTPIASVSDPIKVGATATTKKAKDIIDDTALENWESENDRLLQDKMRSGNIYLEESEAPTPQHAKVKTEQPQNRTTAKRNNDKPKHRKSKSAMQTSPPSEPIIAADEDITTEQVPLTEARKEHKENNESNSYSPAKDLDMMANAGPVERIPQLITGIITDNNGLPITGVKLLDTKNNELATTDTKGNFVLPEIDGYITAAFVGYDSMTIAVSPNIDIKLQESSRLLSQPHKRLVDLMDDEQLILHYRNGLNSLFSKNWPICSLQSSDNPYKPNSTSIAIEIKSSGQFEILHYFTKVPETCQTTIEEVLQQAEITFFEKNRPVSFNLRINL